MRASCMHGYALQHVNTYVTNNLVGALVAYMCVYAYSQCVVLLYISNLFAI
jgi:hypothetical protein